MDDTEPRGVPTAPACAVCQRVWSPDHDPDEWLGVEVDHAGSRVYAAFCSREHAQDWFAKPLPPPPPRPVPPPMETGERVLILVVGGLAVFAAGMFVVGLVVTVRAALGWL